MKNKKIVEDLDVLPMVKNTMNAHLFPSTGEVNNEPSKTVPNQSMTVLEMVEKHRRGLPIEGNIKVPIYNGEDNLPDIQHLDLAEQQQIVEQIAEQFADVKTRLQQKAKTKKEREELERIEAEVQKRLKALVPARPAQQEEGGEGA